MVKIVTLSLDENAHHLWLQIERGKRSEYVRGILKDAGILDARSKRIRALEKQNLRLMHKNAHLRHTLAGQLVSSDDHAGKILEELGEQITELRKLVEEFAAIEEGDFD